MPQATATLKAEISAPVTIQADLDAIFRRAWQSSGHADLDAKIETYIQEMVGSLRDVTVTSVYDLENAVEVVTMDFANPNGAQFRVACSLWSANDDDQEPDEYTFYHLVNGEPVLIPEEKRADTVFWQYSDGDWITLEEWEETLSAIIQGLKEEAREQLIARRKNNPKRAEILSQLGIIAGGLEDAPPDAIWDLIKMLRTLGFRVEQDLVDA